MRFTPDPLTKGKSAAAKPQEIPPHSPRGFAASPLLCRNSILRAHTHYRQLSRLSDFKKCTSHNTDTVSSLLYLLFLYTISPVSSFPTMFGQNYNYSLVNMFINITDEISKKSIIMQSCTLVEIAVLAELRNNCVSANFERQISLGVSQATPLED